MISQRTAGRLSIKVLAQATQGSEKFTVEQLRNGTLDMARVKPIAAPRHRGPDCCSSLPYLFKSTAHMRRVLDGPIGDEILSSIKDQGFIGLCFYDSRFRSFFSVKKPITTAADVKGMKVRVMKAEMWTDIVRALGGTPIWRPGGKRARSASALNQRPSGGLLADRPEHDEGMPATFAKTEQPANWLLVGIDLPALAWILRQQPLY